MFESPILRLWHSLMQILPLVLWGSSILLITVQVTSTSSLCFVLRYVLRCLMFQRVASKMSASIRIACVLIMQLCGCLSEACTQMDMKEGAVGYRCEDREVASHNISVIPRKDCTMLCLQRSNGVQVNYNYVDNNCLLFSSFNKLAQPDKEFPMLRNVDDAVSRGQCIPWVAFPGTLPTGGIVINGPNQLLAWGSGYSWKDIYK